MRGHNLVWATGAQTPSYAIGDGTNSPANQAVVTANIQEHIQNEVQHFGARSTRGMWSTSRSIPASPIAWCTARSTTCSARATSMSLCRPRASIAPAGHQAVHQRLQHRRSQSAGLPGAGGRRPALARHSLDGVGHEMHNAINYPSPSTRWSTRSTLSPMTFPGIEQQVTEFDVSVYNAGDSHLQLRQQHSAIGSGRTGLALRRLLRRVPSAERQDQRASPSGAWRTTTPGSTASPSTARIIRCRSITACRPSPLTGALSTNPSCPATA